jgi:hypothetical protein
VRLFAFEALDESWKSVAEGPLGACWGVFDRTGILKPGMQAVFDGATVPDNWSGTAPVGGPGTPAITFTQVPPYGDLTQLLLGEVQHVAPASHRVAVYIFVNGGWWTKPTFVAPITPITVGGRWRADITTGGVDQDATEIMSFLIPSSYNPPIVAGQPTLPGELNNNAVASLSVTRHP